MATLTINKNTIVIKSQNGIQVIASGEIDDILTVKGQWKNFEGELVKVPEPSNNGNP